MRCILHIGTEKTGTTSFQQFCHLNSQKLLEKGVLYPTGLGGINHRNISIYALDHKAQDDGLRNLGLSTELEFLQFRSKQENSIQAQVKAAHGAHTCILSSEHLHSRLKTTEQIDRVKALLDPLFDEIEVHIHLRPQIDVITSLASTQTRVGGAVTRKFFSNPQPSSWYYNYNKLVTAWEQTFGASQVRLLPFSRHPDFGQYLFGKLDVDMDGLTQIKRINEAIDIRVMAMVNALTQSGTANRIDHRVIDRFPVRTKICPDKKTAQSFQANFHPSNRLLCTRRHDLMAGDLAPAWRKYTEKGNLELLEEKSVFALQLAELVEHYNTIILKA